MLLPKAETCAAPTVGGGAPLAGGLRADSHAALRGDSFAPDAGKCRKGMAAGASGDCISAAWPLGSMPHAATPLLHPTAARRLSSNQSEVTIAAKHVSRS